MGIMQRILNPGRLFQIPRIADCKPTGMRFQSCYHLSLALSAIHLHLLLLVAVLSISYLEIYACTIHYLEICNWNIHTGRKSLHIKCGLVAVFHFKIIKYIAA